MRHRKTPGILLREQRDKLLETVADLEEQLQAEKRYTSALLDKNAKRINADLERMQRDRNRESAR